MKKKKDRLWYCAVCGAEIPGSRYITEPEESGYGYGKMCACSMAHQMVLVRRFQERDKKSAAHRNTNAGRLTASQRERVLEMRKTGCRAQDIAAEVGHSLTAIYKTCANAGMPFREAKA